MENEEVDVEALLTSAMQPEPAPDGESESVDAQALTETETTEEGTQSTESEGGRVIKYKGEDISIDDEKFQTFAQQGYDYNKKMRDFHVEKRVFEAEQEKLKGKYENLAQIEEFAQQNPAFQKLITDQWARIQAGHQLEADPRTQAQIMEHKFQQLQERLDAKEKEDILRKNAALEHDQESGISKFKEENSQIDWITKDEFGSTMEDRIGQVMLDKKIGDFDVAATYVLRDELMKRNALEAKESAAKDIQKANKLGLGKVTKKSMLTTKKAEDVSNKSMDDLWGEGFAELGVTV